MAGEAAVITGGGSGLGLAIAKCLSDAGAHVVITGRRRDVLAAAVAELGDQASYIVHDVTDPAGSDALVAEVTRRTGPVSILVNNAGVHLKKRLLDTSTPDFRLVLETHVVGAFSATRAFVAPMAARGHGSVLFIASMTSLFGMPQVVAYSAAKSAYVGMVRSLATELAPDGIRVNAIAPGWIQSAMLEKALSGDTPRRNKILSRTPMARFGVPEDIGWTAVYLCSRAARFVTGAVLPVDGGASIGF